MFNQSRLPRLLNPNGRCVLLKLGKGIYFFFLAENNLYVKSSHDEGKNWSPPNLLRKNAHGVFDANADHRGNIYIACVAGKKFDLLLLRENKGQWTEETVSPFVPIRGIPYYPKLVVHRRGLGIAVSHICTSLPGAWRIKYYHWEGKAWRSIDIDGGQGLNYNYLAGAIRTNDTLQVLYRFFHKGVYQLKFTSKNLHDSRPGHSAIITQSPGSKYAPCFFKDEERLFAVFLTWEGTDLKADSVYGKGKKWGGERRLLPHGVKPAYPFIIQEDFDTLCFFSLPEGWISVDFYTRFKKPASSHPLIELFTKNGGKSFMSEDFLVKEIKKELEAELKAVRKENEKMLVTITRLQAELEETKRQKEEMENKLFRAQGENIALKKELDQQQRSRQPGFEHPTGEEQALGQRRVEEPRFEPSKHEGKEPEQPDSTKKKPAEIKPEQQNSQQSSIEEPKAGQLPDEEPQLSESGQQEPKLKHSEEDRAKPAQDQPAEQEVAEKRPAGKIQLPPSERFWTLIKSYFKN